MVWQAIFLECLLAILKPTLSQHSILMRTWRLEAKILGGDNWTKSKTFLDFFLNKIIFSTLTSACAFV
jgi:hypothetical protein